MSDLRIRSEAIPDEVWPETFLPPQARFDERLDDGDEDFGPFLAAASRALSRVFGIAVEVLPQARDSGGTTPQKGVRVAPILSGLLATLRLGGDAARPMDPDALTGAANGVAMARHAAAIADALEAVALRIWPADSPMAGLDLEISAGAVVGHAHVAAPPVRERPEIVVEPSGAAVRLDDLAMRVRVEIASDMTLIGSLLPLRPGTVLPINPVPEMPLIVGDHRIGRATVTALPDGRQQAVIVAMAVEAMEARA